MTPQEITDYKQRWIRLGNNNSIQIHSDLAIQAKEWCRRHLERHQWKWIHIVMYTSIHFILSTIKTAKRFVKNF